MEDLEYILNYLEIQYNKKYPNSINIELFCFFNFLWKSWDKHNPYKTVVDRILYCYGKR